MSQWYAHPARRRTRTVLAALVLPWVAGAQTTAPAIPSERVVAVDRFVARYRARLGLPGVAIGIATSDSVLLAKGYGGSTTDGAPITGHTPFHLGSVTKTLTAAAIVRLAREGRVDLDAPVERYLPDFTMRHPFRARSVTLRHLLGHRSGFSQWSGHDERAQRDGRFDHLAPARSPGERAEYSSLNFIVLGRVVEAVSGRAYEQSLRESVLDPLGMQDAFVRGTTPPPGSSALGHQSFFGVQVPRAEPEPFRYLVPAGFAAASAEDLGRFTGSLVRGFTDSGAATLAWGRRRVRGTLVLEHAGNARTSAARVRLVPERGFAISVLANTNSGPFFPATGDLMDGIHAILDGEPAPSLWPRERLFKGVLLVGTALSVAQLARRARRWSAAGHPTRIDGSARILGPLAVDVAGGALLLVGIPRYFGVPLGTMAEYFPDLGVALMTSAVAGVAAGVLHAWTRSHGAQ